MNKTTEKMAEAAKQIIALMETEGTNWVKPWSDIGAPHNAISGKAYRGSNVFWLGLASHAKGYKSNAWATFKQWQEKGATVIKGEQSTPIFFFSMLEKKDKETGETKRFGLWKYYLVFNSEQVEGWQAPTIDKPLLSPIENAEQFVANTGAEIFTGKSGAYFSPISDYIGMPDLQAFDSVEGYYSTLLHELTHWSGHKSRLDRIKSTAFGSEEYAREELVAECGAALLCVLLGVQKQPTPDHAKYLNGWIKAIKSDHRAIFNAISQAQKAVDFLEGLQVRQAMAAE